MGRAVLVLVAVLCALLHTAAAQTAEASNAQNVFNIAGTIYNRTGSLLPLHFNLYGIPVPSNYSDPDILLTLDATSGGTGLNIYCNPGYGSYADPNGQYPGPSYAQWYSDLSTTVNQIFISKNDPYYKSPSSNSSTSPFFICSVINSDANTTTNYTLLADIISNNRTLNMTEQNVLASMYTRCCSSTGACNAWKTQNQGVVSANGNTVDTDFCSFPNQVCSPTGNLYRLNLASFNLSCPWPGDLLSQFSQLATMDLSSNVNLMGNTSTFTQTLSNLTSLQFVNLDGDTGLNGTIDSGTANTNLCKSAKTSILSLSLNGIGLKGTVPSCLYSAGSIIVSLDLGSNNFTGTLSDTIPTNSSLQLFHVDYNLLNGQLPATLGNAQYLVDLDTTQNQLTGTIPSAIGNIHTLQNFVVKMNNLSGAIPDSFGMAPNMQIFDAKQNQLTGLPAAWTNASYNAVNSSFVNIRASLNKITGPFPTGLANATQLTYLILNQNNLTGPLPTNDSMFPGLRALNVSWNQLTGTIPAQLGQSGIFQATPLYLSTGQALQQVFDLSNNKLMGSLPSFLAQQAVPAWTRNGIYLQGNELNVSCSNNSFAYITSICPFGNATQGNSQAPVVAPTAANTTTGSHSTVTSPPPAQTTATGIVTVPTGSMTNPPQTTVSTQTAGGEAPAKHSGGGLSGGAIAGIIIGVVAAVALAIFIAFFAFRRRRDPIMPNMNGGSFGMPHFGDGEFGRKNSLKKGLTSLTSNSSGFERFNDDQQHVELSPNKS